MDNTASRTIRWFFAGILAIVLFIALGVLALGSSVSLQVTQKENIKDAMEEAGIYENAISIAVDTILERASDSGEELALEDVLGGITDEDEIKERLSEVFPPEWIRGQTEVAIDELYAFLSGEQDEINIEVDLSEKEDEIYAAIASFFSRALKRPSRLWLQYTGRIG